MDAVTKHMYQQAIGQVAEKGLAPELRAPHRETIERYVGQLEAGAEETAKQIEQLRAQVLDLQQAADGTVPRGELERVAGDLQRVQKEAEETGRAQEQALEKLRAELEEARKEDPRIADLARQVQELTIARDAAVRLAEELRAKQALGETVPKATYEEAQRTIRELEERIEPLTERLRVVESEENPRVLELKEQIAEFERVREETALKHQEAIRDLEANIERLTLAAKDHAREVEDLTQARDQQAETIRSLQTQMRRYQEAATEVARTSHDQVEAQLTEARRQHGEIVEDTPEAQVNKEVLAYKISLLEAKHKEHLAIQERLLEAHQAGADEVSRSPEYALRNQMQLFDELQRQMEVDAEVLRIPAEQIPQRLEEIRALREKADQERKRMGDVRSEGPEVQLEALRLDQAIAKFDNQLRMLESLQETLEGFIGIGRATAGVSIEELHRVATQDFEVAQREYEELDVIKDGGRDESAIALKGEKVRVLGAQVESLRAAVESYQAHAATQVLADARFLQQLIAVVPGPSQGEAHAYLMNAVKAIKAMQETLAPRYQADRVAHTGIEQLLKDIYRWRGEYMRLIEEVIASTGAYGGVDFHDAKVKLAGFVEQLVRKHAEMDRLLNLPQDQVQAELAQARLDHQGAVELHGQRDAIVDRGRDEVAIAAALVEVQFHQLRVRVLETIQAQHHQPLELKMGVLGTMQRMIVGLLRTVFISIPGTLLDGLQTMGSVLVSKPNNP